MPLNSPAFLLLFLPIAAVLHARVAGRPPLRAAFLIVSRNSRGVVFSIHQTMGSTGSLSVAPGSFFFKRRNCISANRLCYRASCSESAAAWFIKRSWNITF